MIPNLPNLDFINPYNSFSGCFAPNWLVRRKISEVSHGAKLTYARLMQYGGRRGIAYPRQKVLCEELGICERQLRDYIKELEDLKLIYVHQRGFKKSNAYYFLNHPWMEEERRKIGDQYLDGNDPDGIDDSPEISSYSSDRQDTSAHDRQDTSAHDRQDTSAPLEKKTLKEDKEYRGVFRKNAPISDSKFKEKKKGTRIPYGEPDELPEGWRNWSLGVGIFNEQIDRQWEEFKDYYLATTKNPTRLDWFAAWRSWCRKWAEYNKITLNLKPQQTNSKSTTQTTEFIESKYRGIGIESQPILDGVKQTMKNKLEESEYNLYIKPIRFIELRDGLLKLLYPDRYFRDHVLDNYGKCMASIAKEIQPTIKTLGLYLPIEIERPSTLTTYRAGS